MNSQQPRFIELSAMDKVDGTIGRAKAMFSDAPRICRSCERIPFSDGLRRGATTSGYVYLTDLGTILQQKKCPICSLLLGCLREPENDLFAPAHIKDYLKTSDELRKYSNSNDWLDWYKKRDMFERFNSLVHSGKVAWPFGSVLDDEQARAIKEEVKTLFLSAENQDTGTFNFDSNTMSSKQVLNNFAHASQFAIGVANVEKPQRHLAVAHTAAGEITAFTGNAKVKLPCYIAIRIYGQSEDKFGAISVRVYACGRAPMPSVGEICHFTLRADDTSQPREKNGQLWYGRPLQSRPDLDFFKLCLATCQRSQSHRHTCGKALKISQDDLPQSWPLILVDVVDEKLKEVSLGDPIPGYIALSHTWGHLALHPEELMYKKSNKRNLLESGSLKNAQLAATIRDAIEIVRKMDQRYLWVDRLCVNQTESEEKASAIRSMGKIYSQALFTIVDGDSNGSQDGLLNKRRDTSGQIIARIDSHLALFLPTSMPINLSKWESRAWTFQEKLLSRRMLVFSCGFAQWQCQEGVWREDVNARDVNKQALAISHSYFTVSESGTELTDLNKHGLQKDPLDGSIRLYRTPAFSQYAQCVYDYSMRCTGQPSEILEACTGILSVLGSRDLLDTEFLHGLPQKFIDSALLWQAPFNVRRRDVKFVPKPASQNVSLPDEMDPAFLSVAAYPRPSSSRSRGSSPVSPSSFPPPPPTPGIPSRNPHGSSRLSGSLSLPSAGHHASPSNSTCTSSASSSLDLSSVRRNSSSSNSQGITPSSLRGVRPELPPRPKPSQTNNTSPTSLPVSPSAGLSKGPPLVNRARKPGRELVRTDKVPPPSWSWAGWELARGPQIVKQACEGPRVFYRTPFQVHFDALGMKMHLKSKGEERMRPLARISFVPRNGTPSIRLGLLANHWMYPAPEFMPHETTEFSDNDWEYHSAVPSDKEPDEPSLTDRNLIISTETAKLFLGCELTDMQTYSLDQETAYPELEVKAFEGYTKANERWLYRDESKQHQIGTARLSALPSGETQAVQAILLSEAQYLGDELRPDVMGYPLYNIMLIENGVSGFKERIGIGKVRKTGWRQVKPDRKVTTIILG